MASDRHSKVKPRNIRASRKKGRPSRIFASSSSPSAVRFSLMAKSATTLLHNCAAFAPVSDRHAKRSRSHSKAFFAPVASPPGARRAVPGVVPAASPTGQTVFVEPLEAIDLNNRFVQLSEEEIAEIA